MRDTRGKKINKKYGYGGKGIYARCKGAIKLEKYVLKHNYTLRQAAHELKIDYTNLYYLMVGRHKPSLKTATKLTEKTDIKITDWFK